MLIVAAYAAVKNGMGKEFQDVARDCVAKTRQEAGNISYTLLANTEDPNRFTFFEEWKSQADLDAHGKTAHFQAFAKGIENLLAQPLEIKIYAVEPVK